MRELEARAGEHPDSLALLDGAKASLFIHTSPSLSIYIILLIIS